MAEIIEGLHAVDVDADALLSQERRQLRVAAATLVPRHIKRDHTHAPEVLQRLVDRCTPLIQARAFRTFIHVLPPFVAPTMTCTILTHGFAFHAVSHPMLQNRNKKSKSAYTQTCLKSAYVETGNAPLRVRNRVFICHFKKLSVSRVYIAILLLLLFIDQFTSLRV